MLLPLTPWAKVGLSSASQATVIRSPSLGSQAGGPGRRRWCWDPALPVISYLMSYEPSSRIQSVHWLSHVYIAVQPFWQQVWPKEKKKPLLVFTSHFLPNSPNSSNCTWMFFLCRLAVWDFAYKCVHVVWFVWLLWFSMMLSSFIHVEACVHTYSLPCLLIHCTDMSPLSTHALVVILLVFLFCPRWIMLPERLCTSRREFSFSFLVVFISECNYWVIW